MNRLLRFFSFVLIVFSFISCGKDGPEGPLGPQGERGAAGAQGDNGIDGNSILNGTSNPTASLGEIGDFYIHTNSYVIYGPKTSSGWGSGKSILGTKGDKGATGARGATGAKGDKGDTGARGATGAKGDKGDTGARGATGAKGDKGDTGARGATGAKGDKGDKGEADYVILSGPADPTNTNTIGSYGDFYYNTVKKTLWFGYYESGSNSPAWGQIAKLSNTIQFSKTIDLRSFVEQYLYVHLDLPGEVLEKSMVSVYVRPFSSGSWYPLPGHIDSTNEYRIALSPRAQNQSQTTLTIIKTSGNSGYPNTELRVVVTEAEVFETISKKVDFRDYMDVSRYFQFGN